MMILICRSLHTLFIFIFLLCSSCKQKSNSAAIPQHQFGNTVVRSDDFHGCLSSLQFKDYPATHEYLERLKNHIANANSETFSGNLDPKNICLVLSTADSGVGGEAFGDSGKIEIERKTVVAAANDAELAGVICHEMAHVAMRHMRITQNGPKGEIFDFSHGKGAEHYFRQLEKDVEYLRLKDQLDALNRKFQNIKTQRASLEIEMFNLVKSLVPSEILKEMQTSKEGSVKAREWFKHCTSLECRKLRNIDAQLSVYGKETFDLHASLIPALEFAVYQYLQALIPKDVFITWAEREADEVGLEFCVRAGFETSLILNKHASRLRSSSSSPGLYGYRECRVAIDKALNRVRESGDSWGRINEIPIAQGYLGSHPDECWRLFNLERELVLHSAAFRPFLKNLKNVIEGGLKGAKSEIKEYERN